MILYLCLNNLIVYPIGNSTHPYSFQLIQKLQIQPWLIARSPKVFAILFIIIAHTIFQFDFVFYIIIYPGWISVITHNNFIGTKFVKTFSMISFSKFTF